MNSKISQWDNLTNDELLCYSKDLGIPSNDNLQRDKIIELISEHFRMNNSKDNNIDIFNVILKRKKWWHLFSKKQPKGRSEQICGMKVVDCRNEGERQIEYFAKKNIRVNNEVDSLIQELVQIGSRERYISEKPGGLYNCNKHNIRARNIGYRLYSLGGHNLMLYAYYRVGFSLDNQIRGDLEYAWHNIGEWIA